MVEGSGKVIVRDMLDNFFIQMDDSRERSLAYEIVMGVLRLRGLIDWQIEHFTKKSLLKSPLEIRNILRAGAYQICFLDRVPDFAVVNESVNLTRVFKLSGYSGFINSVLRRITENRKKFQRQVEDDTGIPIEAVLSHPKWLFEKWTAILGKDETRLLCKANNRRPGVVIRCNTLKTAPDDLKEELNAAGIEAGSAPYAKSGLVIGRGLPESHRMINSSFVIQDEASQLVTTLLEPKPGERILDACAGVGMKTTHIAEMINDKGEILAVDQSEKKLIELRSLCNKMSVDSVKTKQINWLNEDLDDSCKFDKILLDAPCTGTGVLSRNPDIKWQCSKKDIFRMKQLQIKLLQKISGFLISGGLLLFVTCSLEPEEGGEVVDIFLHNNPGFELNPVEIDRSNSMTDKDGYFRTWPHIHNMGGFFAALLKKK